MTFDHFQRLALGVWVAFDDDEFKVVGLNGTTVMLQDIAGRPQIVLLAALLSSPGFRVIEGGRHRAGHPARKQIDNQREPLDDPSRIPKTQTDWRTRPPTPVHLKVTTGRRS
jgi:hypothetical protein